MDDKKKKVFVKPELIKFDQPLDKVTLSGTGSPCIQPPGPPECLSCGQQQWPR